MPAWDGLILHVTAANASAVCVLMQLSCLILHSTVSWLFLCIASSMVLQLQAVAIVS